MKTISRGYLYAGKLKHLEKLRKLRAERISLFLERGTIILLKLFFSPPKLLMRKSPERGIEEQEISYIDKAYIREMPPWRW